MQYDIFFPQPEIHMSVICAHFSSERLLRTFSVQPGVIPCLLAGVHVHPPLLLLRVHLRPNMVFLVPYPSDPRSHRPAQHREAIGPLAATSSPAFQQRPDIVVSRKPFELAAVVEGTLVELNPSGAPGRFIWHGRCEASCYSGRPTDRTWRVIDEGEEVPLEPSVGIGGQHCPCCA